MILTGDLHSLEVYDELNWTLIHPGCATYETSWGFEHDCAVAYWVNDLGLWETLEEVLAPGHYEISAWYEKHYSWEYGSTEYDGGLTVVDNDDNKR